MASLDIIVNDTNKTNDEEEMCGICLDYFSEITDTIITDTLTQEDTTVENDLGEIRYTCIEGQTFQQASVKLKSLLEENGYNYNEVKTKHVFFIIDNNSSTLNWAEAVKLYYHKKQPKAGDYFFMKKFFY